MKLQVGRRLLGMSSPCFSDDTIVHTCSVLEGSLVALHKLAGFPEATCTTELVKNDKWVERRARCGKAGESHRIRPASRIAQS